ncbi:MAG TPA: CPBP family intramembrane glutamic endopeptidase, partial [Roseivirga sp.]
LFDKTPAWLKAVLYNLMFLFPVIIIIQQIVFRNIYSNIRWGWGLIPVIVILMAYWFLTKRLSRFQKDRMISHSLKITGNWLQIASLLIGLCLFTGGMVFLLAGLIPTEDFAQLQTILAFQALEPAMAIPLLLALALSAGFVEEITYRGFMQHATSSRYHKWLSFFIVGLLFSLAHRLPLALFIPYLLVSMTYSVVADHQKSLGLVILAHVLIDFTIFILIYLSVIDLTATKPGFSIISGLVVCIGAFLILFAKKFNQNQKVQVFKEAVI